MTPAASKPRPPIDCPVAAIGEITVAQARLLNQSLRQYRKATKRCRTCTTSPDCAIRATVNATIDQAIREVAEEWNL